MAQKYCPHPSCGARFESPALAPLTKCPECKGSLVKGYVATAAYVPPVEAPLTTSVRAPSQARATTAAIELDDSQCAFVQANYTAMGSLDIARSLFPDVAQIGPLSPEFRAVNRFINDLVTKPPRQMVVDSEGDEDDRHTSKVGDYEIQANARLLAQTLNPADFTVNVDRSSVVRFGDLAQVTHSAPPAAANKKTRKARK